jgi:MFS family permease
VRALFGITFLTRAISIIVQTVSPIILVKILDTPAAEIGWMIAGFWIANALGIIIAAGIIRSRNRSTLSGFAVLALAFFGAAMIHDPLGYSLSIVLSGLGLSLVQAFLVPTMHLSGTEERPHKGIADYSTALSLGMIVGPLVAGASIFLSGFYNLFFILVAISIVVLVAAFRIGIQKSFKGEDTRRGILPSNIIKTMKQRAFAGFYMMNFLYSLLLPILISYGGVFAEDKFHVTTIEALILFAAVFSISSVLRILFSRSEKRHFQQFLITGFVMLAFSFTLIGFSNGLYLFLAGFLLFSVPHALIYPVTTYLALDSAGPDALISSTYIFATSSGVAEFISPLAAVPIITFYGFSALFFVLAPIAVIGLIISMAMPRLFKWR